MKQVFIGFLFFIISTSIASAQERDTTQITTLLFPFEESLKLNKDGIKISPVIPDYRYSDRRLYSSDRQIVFKPEKARKRTILLNIPYSGFIIPTALISYGILAREHDGLQKLDYSTHHEVTEHYMGRLYIDDYTQFVPAVAVYGLDLMGVEAKHNFRDRTFVMTTSYLLMSASVQTIKRITKVERPDGSNDHSFPSGHTATSFVGAHILYKEYKDISPWIGIASYAVASGTGVMRVINKKHWVSDVVTGAGIGILSVEISYMLLPAFHNLLGIKDSQKNLVIAPVIGNDNYGVGLAYTF
jgi:hypothetical protein